MRGNNFFDSYESRNDVGEAQVRDISRPAHTNQDFQDQQQPISNANWNGISPRNRQNQAHYQRAYDSPAGYEIDEDLDDYVEEPRPVGKRLGSPLMENRHPKRQARGQSEQFTGQQRMAVPLDIQSDTFRERRYSNAEFRLPRPVEAIQRGSGWTHPEEVDYEIWPSVERGGLGDLSTQSVPRQQHNFSTPNDRRKHSLSINMNGERGSGLRERKAMVHDSFENTQFRQRSMSMALDPFEESRYEDSALRALAECRRNYKKHNTIDLVTPESVPRQRIIISSATNSESSALRRGTETEPTDLENDYDETGGIQENDYTGYRSPRRIPNDMSGNGMAQLSSFGNSTSYENHFERPFSHMRQRQRQKLSDRLTSSNFVPVLDNEYTDSPRQSAARQLRREHDRFDRRGRENIVHHQTRAEEDQLSDEDGATMENAIRKSRFPHNKVSQNGRGSVSDHSNTANRSFGTQQEAQDDSFSRIRGPAPSNMVKPSGLHDRNNTSGNDTSVLHGVIKQTTAQINEALKKEQAEIQRQEKAKEAIARKEKQGKQAQAFDPLFDEPPVDEEAQARIQAEIQKTREREKARKQTKEEAEIRNEDTKMTQETVIAHRKQKEAEEREKYSLQKKERVTEQRKLDDKRDAERLEAKRKAASQKLKLQHMTAEEDRLKRLDAQRKAVNMGAASLRLSKKSAKKQNPVVRPAEIEQSGILVESEEDSDGGLFVSVESDPIEEALEKQPPIGANDIATNFESVGDEIPIIQESIINPEATGNLEADSNQEAVVDLKAADGPETTVIEESARAETSGNSLVIGEPASTETTEATLPIHEPRSRQEPRLEAVVNVPLVSKEPDSNPANGALGSEQKPEIATDEARPLSESAYSVQQPTVVEGKDKNLAAAVVSTVDNPIIVANTSSDVSNIAVTTVEKTPLPASAVAKPTRLADDALKPSITATLIAGTTSMPALDLEKPKLLSDRPPTNVPKTSISSVEKASSIPVADLISNIASDGRRRPPEVSRPRLFRPKSPDPIRFTGTARTTKDARVPDRTATLGGSKKPQNKDTSKDEAETNAKLQKQIKEVADLKKKIEADAMQQTKEFNDRMDKMAAMIESRDQRETVATRQQNKSGKARTAVSNAGQGNLISWAGGHSKTPSYSSRLELVSTVASRARDAKKAEEHRLAKFDKDKEIRRKRYDREIRTILVGQGLEPDDEKISKQVDEKMAVWEENRRKKDRRDSDVKGSSDHHRNQEDPSASDLEHGPPSPRTLPNANDEGAKDPNARKEQERSQATRKGLQFLASQNKGVTEFSKAASMSRVQGYESDESEEDPDDEPETSVVRATRSTSEQSEEMTCLESDEGMDPAALDTSIVPSLPKAPESPGSKNAFLAGIVNPKEKDIMHKYTVRHRAARADHSYESIIIGVFHSLEEANAFAQQKISEFPLGPLTGKSETHDDENLYIGTLTTDKDKDHNETIWVKREIAYIGDFTKVKHGDLKTILIPKVFNVMQVLHREDGTHVGSVIATASIKALANQKAVDQILALSKPSRPKMDSLANYTNTVVPMIRQHQRDAEASDATLEFEGPIPDTNNYFSIIVSENTVVGPLN